MNSEQRKMFILSYTLKKPVQRRRGNEEVRNYSFYYSLPDEEGKKHEVCKTYLLTTFGFTKNNDTMLHNILKKTLLKTAYPRHKTNGVRIPHCT